MNHAKSVSQIQMPNQFQWKASAKNTEKNTRKHLTKTTSAWRLRYHDQITHNKRRNDCVEAFVRAGLNMDLRTIVLVESIPHLYILDTRFSDIHHAMLSGSAATKEERLDACKEMDAGRLPLILASRIFAKGIDILTVGLIIDASGTPGVNSSAQRHGRGTRCHENKTGLIFVDVQDRGKFLQASRSREEALRGLGVEIQKASWQEGADAEKILRTALGKLRSEIVKGDRSDGK